jgi:Pyruvate/2-oxoacid:ferredoxin oxidoreductase gamma subunit
VVAALGIAAAAGSRRSVNAVMLGAASMFLPVRQSTFEECIAEAFAGKGSRIIDANLTAFRGGRQAVSEAQR